MTTDPATLARLAKCYCFNARQARAALIYVLALWYQKKSLSPIDWKPADAVATWTDSSGAHTGNLAVFQATPTWQSTTSLILNSKGLTSITGLNSLTSLATINVGGNPGLAKLECYGGGLLSVVSITNCPGLSIINLSGGTLSVITVGLILTACVSNATVGNLIGGSLSLQGQTPPATPSGSGITNKANLQGSPYLWTVLTD